MRLILILILLLITLLTCADDETIIANEDVLRSSNLPSESDEPSIYLAIIARNAAHLLPNYLGYIEQLNYPKQQITVGIYTDHNADNTVGLLSEWVTQTQHLYHKIYYNEDQEISINIDDLFNWTKERLKHIIDLRQRVLEDARKEETDYIFFVDCDNFLVNSEVLNKLLQAKKPIVAPLLTVNEELAFSNFWAGQDNHGYYVRTPEYLPIVTRKKVGCFKVPLVHSTLLIDLRTEASKQLQYWPPPDGYKWNTDDIIILSYSARVTGMGMYVLNTEFFGYMLKPKEYDSFDEAAAEFINWKIKTLVSYPPLPVSQFITVPEIPKDKVGTDAIFMISLVRRPERRNRMIACLKELALDYILFDAIDGRQLNNTYLEELGIHYMPGWRDPWGERPMTFGEVGCFLSHYFIWSKMRTENLQTVLILEDDIDFEPDFKERVLHILEEIENVDQEWDLIYAGRKALHYDLETVLPGTHNLVKPKYSYWTLGYLISLRGAQKLLDASPFDNLLPVDEYIPIMFDEHPETSWASYYQNRNLRAYSAYPLLLYPTHYVGDEGWFSDTEPPPEILEEIRQRKIKEEEEANGDDAVSHSMKTEL